MQSEPRLHQNLDLSIAAIQEVFHQENVAPLKKPRRLVHSIRYNRPVPGDMVQMDTMKIIPGVYRYTAIDYCTRWRVLGIYLSRGNARQAKVY
jgi:hypothetical protein